MQTSHGMFDNIHPSSKSWLIVIGSEVIASPSMFRDINGRMKHNESITQSGLFWSKRLPLSVCKWRSSGSLHNGTSTWSPIGGSARKSTPPTPKGRIPNDQMKSRGLEQLSLISSSANKLCMTFSAIMQSNVVTIDYSPKSQKPPYLSFSLLPLDQEVQRLTIISAKIDENTSLSRCDVRLS